MSNGRRARSGISVLLSSILSLSLASPAAATPMFPGGAFSDDASGSTGATFLRLPTSARLEAMGETVAAGAQGVDAMFYNPAGMARLDPLGPADITLGYMNFLNTINSGSILYARPHHYGPLGFAVLGLGFLYQSQSEQTRFNALGDNIGSFSPSDFVVSASLAKRLGKFQVGMNAKLIHSNVDDATGIAVATDFGFQIQNVADFGEAPLDIGASVVNFGSPIKLGGASFPLPMMVRGGALWRISPIISFAIDGNFPIDQDPYSSLGVEAKFPLGNESRNAFLRGGFNQRYSRGVDGLAGFSVGGGLDFTRMRFDYAWTPYGDLGMTNKINLGFRF